MTRGNGLGSLVIHIVILVSVASGRAAGYLCSDKTELFTFLKTLKAMKKEDWKMVLKLVVAIATAILSTLGVASCAHLF